MDLNLLSLAVPCCMFYVARHRICWRFDRDGTVLLLHWFNIKHTDKLDQGVGALKRGLEPLYLRTTETILVLACPICTCKNQYPYHSLKGGSSPPFCGSHHLAQLVPPVLKFLILFPSSLFRPLLRYFRQFPSASHRQPSSYPNPTHQPSLHLHTSEFLDNLEQFFLIKLWWQKKTFFFKCTTQCCKE